MLLLFKSGSYWSNSKRKQIVIGISFTMHKYSIIIPSLNEEKFLPGVLKNIKKFTEMVEIIVSDGGSTDNTINIAEKLGVKVCRSKKGKGVQMNRAAKSSNG
ncbi:MAG: hypothetical protein DRQ01_06885, partial [Ignavibacteriae bacterium]